MFRSLLSALRFFRQATAGHRFRPWRSPYLRWRMETYTGKPAASLRLSDFLHLAVSERSQMLRFFSWINALGKLANDKRL